MTEVSLKELLDLIKSEDKKNPMTDEEISEILSVRRDKITQLRKKNQIPDSRERGRDILKREAEEILKKDDNISERQFTKLLNDRGFKLSRRLAAELKKELLPGNPDITNKVKISEVKGEKERRENNFSKKDEGSLNKDNLHYEEERGFHKLIGSRNSLKTQISQAKAAVLYPPFGLHTLILGPSGVGKSQMAEAMYSFAVNSGKLPKDAPFIVFNCADYSDNPQLLLSQLFGYVKGAFTGADSAKQGLVEKADGGILFLDEVHRLPSEGQEILFLLLDKGQFRRMGESENTRSVNFMLIAATTENPESSLLLTFRRRVPMVIELPSLKERPYSERYDIIKDFFLQESFRIGRTLVIDTDCVAALMLYDCPGNVGQLRSDIQVACARGFLSYMSEEKENIHITLNELPKNVSINYSKYNNKFSKIQEYIDYSLIASPDNKGISHSKEDRYVLPEKIYQFIEEKYRNLEEEGLNKKEIDEVVGKQVDIELKKFAQNIKTVPAASKEELKEIVGEEVAYAAEVAVETAKQRIGSLQDNFYFSLAIHLSAAYERIKAGKDIINPQTSKVIIEMPYEYETAEIMAEQINKHINITLPKEEIAFIAMYLKNFSKNKNSEKAKIGIIVLSHGHIACAMAEVANRLMGVNHAVGIEMSLEENPMEVYKRVLDTAVHIDEGKGILILADMGSLLSFGEKITKEAGIKVRTLGRVDTVMVIEAVRKAMLPECSVDDIYEYLYKYGAYSGIDISEESKKLPGAVVTICITGEGAALTAKKYVEDLLREINKNIEVIPVSMIKQENIEETIHEIQKKYNILSVIGTINPKIQNVPFLPLAHIVKEDGLKSLKRILMKNNEERGALEEIINSDLILFDSQLSNKGDLLEKLSNLLLKKGYVDENYLLSVYKREMEGSTLMEGEIALPHGDPQYVRKPAIAIAKMNSPMEWENKQSADLVFLFALNEDSKKYFNDIYNIITDKSALMALRNAVNTEDFLKKILEHKKYQ
ncbi:sigma 54-interacting transcriptional regulator [Clostridium polynesiense]|uniref:sigma 54-interacting transcriptional regulator n=1 Tax=Clostridium polynesiense TaxID=1325933 RepID=UPI00059136A1|nr:sigma 54-interacting transcriptional regulator [Clostridium polynesiense]